MQVTVEIINVYKVTGKNGKSKEFNCIKASPQLIVDLDLIELVESKL